MRISPKKNQLKPVAFVELALNLNGITLPASNVLLAPLNRNQITGAGSTRVHVAKGAAAFIVNNGSELCVMGLLERKFGDISIVVDGKTFNLHAGEELVVSIDGKTEINQKNPVPGIGKRNLTTVRLTSGSQALIREFSIPSALLRINTLTSLASSAKPEDRRLHLNIMKTAAALQVITMAKGPYR
jgi:hypothetical protein